MKIQKEELFLGTVLVPMCLCLGVLLSSVKAPHEIFSSSPKKNKAKQVQNTVPVKDEVKEEAPKIESAPSLSESLAPPSPSLSGDLKSLSAGVVSEGGGTGGGMNITQGETSTAKLVEESSGERRLARAVQVVSPSYPQSAQARGIEGFVVLEVVVSERGKVTEARVLASEPKGLFDAVAIEAIKKWTFDPGRENGKMVVSRLKQKVNFALN